MVSRATLVEMVSFLDVPLAVSELDWSSGERFANLSRKGLLADMDSLFRLLFGIFKL